MWPWAPWSSRSPSSSTWGLRPTSTPASWWPAPSSSSPRAPSWPCWPSQWTATSASRPHSGPQPVRGASSGRNLRSGQPKTAPPSAGWRRAGPHLCPPLPRYKAVVTPRRAAVAIAGCWTLSFLVGLTPMFGWNNLSEVRRAWAANGSVGEPVIKCEFEKVISMEYMVYFNFFVWVLPPLLLMVLIYLEVFHLIRKQLAKKVSASAGDPQKYYGKELRIAKSLALVLVLFALSWLPLHVLNCITLFCPSCRKPSVLVYIAIFLTHGNSAMNPIVYAFRIQKFRVTFLKIWNDHFRCQPAPPTGEDAPEDRPAD
ncbi:adenosine receptor A1 isoform X4 [Rhinolophus ferrumequinum]|uniref:adenosine receptor A1 isoform X4 n=1 Tax=Rhinolophus ferrumequinum TaxID=59479 RepID=UPI00140FD9CC|nr:adenosine receptor A1 isoform X4 [Rhinolophus ferrumequinum]